MSAGECGNLTLGVVSTGKYFAPKIVALLREAMPDVSVQLVIGNRTDTIARLARGELDLCIMGRPPRLPLGGASTFAEHPHVLVAAPDHPLARRRLVGSAELLEERFVLREEGSGTRIMAERFLDEIGKGRIFETYEMGSNETIKQAVMAGLGIAVLSAHTVAHELETGRLVALDVPGFPIIRHWFIVSPAHVHETPIAARVRDWLAENSAAFMPQVQGESAPG
nr:LysR substrate-binding domain-containing protein [Vannielia litorea]